MKKYQQELIIGSLLVKRASILSDKIIERVNENKDKHVYLKTDNSPVTISDYACQAVINHGIRLNFKDDLIIGEEDPESLEEQGNEEFKKNILDIIYEVQETTKELNEKIGEIKNYQELYNSIKTDEFESEKKRYWVLDPIDGTKGFINNRQYAICLSLIVDKEVVLGIIGCPNLAEDFNPIVDKSKNKGWIFYAIKGEGSYCASLFSDMFPVTLDQQKRIKMRQNIKTKDLKFIEGFDKHHSLHDFHKKIKLNLKLSESEIANSTINLDSQAKYCLLARGIGDVFFRILNNPNYGEKIWDHTAGFILVEESGGVIFDTNGDLLSFNNNKILTTKGIITCSKSIYSEIIGAVKKTYNMNK